ncbi:MAG: hypothetical protein WB760_08505 [Xanthobacteraceae bacterium]
MSTDPSATAIGRLDAAVEESSRRSAVPSDELADLATAIERIESLIVEGAAQGPDGSAAVERLADIAFALHERELESSLGDELKTAVREINDVGALTQVSPERAQQAAELLRQLSRRVHDMIAQSKVEQSKADRPGPAWKRAQFVIADEDDEEDETPNDGSFKTDVPEDDEFALVVAALTAALPSLAEFGAPVPVPPAALAQDVAPPTDDTPMPELSMEAADEAKTAESEAGVPPAETSGETVVVIESSSTILLDESVLPPTPSSEEESSSKDASALSDTLLDDLLRDAVRGEYPTSEAPAEAVIEPLTEPEAPAEDSAPKALLALPPPETTTEPAHEDIVGEPPADLAEQSVHGDDARDSEAQLSRETEEQKAADVVVPVAAEAARPPSKDPSSVSLLPLVAPDDDPGDLFDVTPPVPSNAASKSEPIVAPSEITLEPAQAIRAPLAASMPSDTKPRSPPSPLPPQQSRVAAAPVQPQPVPRPASNDPLGPVRALSEEETIALFS